MMPGLVSQGGHLPSMNRLTLLAKQLSGEKTLQKGMPI
jgi:hypothetical protein